MSNQNITVVEVRFPEELQQVQSIQSNESIYLNSDFLETDLENQYNPPRP